MAVSDRASEIHGQEGTLQWQSIYSFHFPSSPLHIDLELSLVSIYFSFILYMEKAAVDPWIVPNLN